MSRKNNRRNTSNNIRKQAAEMARALKADTTQATQDASKQASKQATAPKLTKEEMRVRLCELFGVSPEDNKRAIKELKTQDASKQETQAARPFPDSTACAAVDAYNEYIKKPHYNTSLELMKEGKVNRLWKIRRGVKGYCALVERLETMGLLDANDCLNFSNVRTLNIMIRTRGLQKMFDNKVLTPVASPLVDLETLAPSLTLVDRPKTEHKSTGKKPAKANKSRNDKNAPKTKAPNIDNLSTADCQALLKALMVKMGVTSLSL